MNQKPSIAELAALAVIAAHGSFRKAADELGYSPSTLSHMMRTLEASMGVRLLHRTTRSVSPTEVCATLLARMQPILRDFDAALGEAALARAQPAGVLRINTSEMAAGLLLEKVVPTFLARFPDVALDLVTEGRLVDIVAAGFDAGVRLGEAVPQDMIAARFGGNTRFIAVASPRYLKTKSAPVTPDDLRNHRCIRFRLPSGKLFRWEFARRGQEVTIDVPGMLTLDHHGLMAAAAVKGVGIAYVAEHVVTAHLAKRTLVRVLDEWCPSIPGLFVYYPGHRLVPPALAAFLDVLRECNEQA